MPPRKRASRTKRARKPSLVAALKRPSAYDHDVASVRAVGTVASPRPPVVTIVPWAALAAWGVGTLAVLSIAGWLATRGSVGR